ncbi:MULTISPECIES: hypothetical protein [Shewanella]|uniref:Transmembrane protein n=1 Tax=Shewanella putrefaciens (strain CN-32 / ATCC BAA-453) TaxID=319224 RepID=A4Y2F9_SHEPC|nr:MULTISPECIES: hypothetical protein [Shewanella]ABM23114.1 hypothetical protein Sputw3181_0263 [Shewanella sp. W3-18-1]QGS47598.1 hypothetical protein FOB89_01015 [Shewanella putrefaciens]CAD6367483.1 hypothetical protein SHEWT2_02795 [Shewanella hafniensis]
MNNKVAPQQSASTEQETQPLDDSRYEDLPRSEFLQLPQEEQDRLNKLRQQRVREAPTLHEWDIKVATVYAMGWLVVIIPCGIMVLIGLVAYWYESDQWYGFFFMALIFAPFIRYLWLADKQYHYRLTTEGLVTTYHDAIPDVAYAVVRGLAWFGVVVCIVGVAFLGPAVLVGAGGFAVMAFFFTGFKNIETTYESPIKNGHRHLIKVTRNRPFIACQSDVRTMGLRASIRLHCPLDKMHIILSLLMTQLPDSEIRVFKNERVLDGVPFASFESGEPAQLADFAPENTHAV